MTAKAATGLKTAPTIWEYETLLIGNDKLTIPPALARVATAGPRPWPASGFEDASLAAKAGSWSESPTLPPAARRWLFSSVRLPDGPPPTPCSTPGHAIV